MRYVNVCVAGTFDGLHAGHEALLLRAFAEGERVLIGVTSSAYVQAHKQDGIRIYNDRVVDLTGWIEMHGFTERSTIVSIDDPFEPAASDASLEALVVSEESKKNGEALNDKRVSRGLSPLVLIVVPLVPAQDLHPISSSRMRAGEIDRDGSLVMPDTLRNDLSSPLGVVLDIEGIARVLEGYTHIKNILVITVGDMTTKTFLDAGITPQLMVVDNKINRRVFIELQSVFIKHRFVRNTLQSGPGFISQHAIDTIHSLLCREHLDPTVLEIDGEEDLLTLPVVLDAPIGSVVYYGQPNEGIVEVVVTEEKKKEVRRILSGFIVS